MAVCIASPERSPEKISIAEGGFLKLISSSSSYSSAANSSMTKVFLHNQTLLFLCSIARFPIHHGNAAWYCFLDRIATFCVFKMYSASTFCRYQMHSASTFRILSHPALSPPPSGCSGRRQSLSGMGFWDRQSMVPPFFPGQHNRAGAAPFGCSCPAFPVRPVPFPFLTRFPYPLPALYAAGAFHSPR